MLIYLDKCIAIIKKNLKTLSLINSDGRINSALNEKEVIEALRECKEISSLIKVPVSKNRPWYDFSLQNENGVIYVNIKISTFDTADNCSSKEGMGYALTGIKKFPANFEGFHDVLYKNITTGYDYYFLLINKNDFRDSYWTSLKRIESLVSNGNNLPFQCNWGRNKTFTKRSEKEQSKYIVEKYLESWDKKIAGYPSNLKRLLEDGLWTEFNNA